MLELTVADQQQAERLLEDGAVAGIITVGESIGLGGEAVGHRSKHTQGHSR